MKKISYFIASFILTAAFSTPLFAFAAQSCSALSAPCPTGYTCNAASDTYDASGECVPSSVAGGSGAINPKYLQDYKTGIIWVINFILLPVLVAVAFITFLWGVYKYFILGADSDTERATGRQFVLWGIIGFVIIFTIWSLVNLVSVTLSLPSGKAPPTPML